jgi:hypothetical protein
MLHIAMFMLSSSLSTMLIPCGGHCRFGFAMALVMYVLLVVVVVVRG